MSDFGCLNNANNTATLSASSTLYYFVGGNFPGGNITGLFAYAADRAGNPAFNDFDVGIYSGGSSSGPSGASFLVATKRYNGITIGSGTNWEELLATGDVSVTSNGVGAAFIWLVFRSNDGLDLKQVADGADEGDFGTGGFGDTGSVTGSSGPGASWPSSFPSNASAHTETMKMRITYTASGGGTNVGKQLWPGPGISPNRQTQFQSRPLAVTNDRSVGLTGQLATFTPGTLTAVITPLSIGQGRITGPGISPDYLQLFKAAPRGFTTPSTNDVTVALTGQNATFTAGTLTANLSVALTGQSGTFVAGTLTPAIDKALSGQSATFSPGTLAPAIDIALLGQNATFATGLITGQATGDVTVALSGIQAVFVTGQMIAAGADTVQAFSGGFFYDFGEHIQKRRKKRQEIEEAREAEESIEQEIDRNIARLLHEQEEKDAERKDLERIRALVKKYKDIAPIEIDSERVQKAIVAAQQKASLANVERLQREFERMLEEEEHAVLMLLASLD